MMKGSEDRVTNNETFPRTPLLNCRGVTNILQCPYLAARTLPRPAHAADHHIPTLGLFIY